MSDYEVRCSICHGPMYAGNICPKCSASTSPRPIVLEGVCCQYCIHFEQDTCPVDRASPWSRWGNWCNVYTRNPDEPEARPLPFTSSHERERDE